jgi:hypothetical protein
MPTISSVVDRRASDAAFEPDWVGLWFKLVEEVAGEYIGMSAGRVSSDGDGIRWSFLPHDLYDGVGGFVHMLRRELNDPAIEMPAADLGRHPAPSRLGRTTALLRYLARRRPPAAAWKSLDRSWQPPSGGAKSPNATLATFSFDVARTDRLAEKARSEGVSLNSLLLSAVVRATAPELEAGPARWMIPYNMRGMVPQRRPTANCLSLLEIELGAGPTPAEVHREIKRALAALEHWGSWLFLNSGRVIGYSNMRRIYVRESKKWQRRHCVGSFSSMGRWDGIGKWYTTTPVSHACPLGIDTITCDGSLAITMAAHPSICRDPAWVQGLLDRVVAETGV